MFMLLFWALVGLVVGSFLGAYTYRYPRGISIAKGRSFCPHCRKKISWFDNIPIGSFFVLKGRCRRCGRKISWRYPLLELITALGFVAFAPNLYLLFIFTLLLAIFVIDLEKGIVPDELVFLGLVVTLLIFIFQDFNFYGHLLFGLGAALFLLLIHLITLGKGMGLGDVKLVLFLGTILGWQTPLFLFISFLMGAGIGLLLVVFKKAHFGRPIPFGPFLISAFFVILIWGEVIKKWVLF